MSRNDFGSVRRLPSGRYQARYCDAEGHRRIAAATFVRLSETRAHLRRLSADLDRGAWFDPRAGRETLAGYSAGWLSARTVAGALLAPRTVALYRSQLDKHSLPALGALELRHLTPQEGWGLNRRSARL